MLDKSERTSHTLFVMCTAGTTETKNIYCSPTAAPLQQVTDTKMVWPYTEIYDSLEKHYVMATGLSVCAESFFFKRRTTLSKKKSACIMQYIYDAAYKRFAKSSGKGSNI